MAKQARPGQALDFIAALTGVAEGACVYWPFGRFADGYAAVQVNGRKWRAHRYICTRHRGLPPTPQHDAAHSCGRGHLACVNPRHVYWATRAENLADRERHGTVNRGQRNGQAKLTEAQAREVLALRNTGAFQKGVAARYGVSRELIGRVWRRQAWAWL